MLQSPKEFLSPVKVVAFDFDQTLVDEAGSIRERWQGVLKKFTHLHENIEEKFFSIFDSRGYAYKRHLDDLLQELELPQEHKKPMIDLFLTTPSSREHVYENVHDVIMLLKQQGFRVGVLTDGRKDYQERRLRRSGIYNLLDFIYYGDNYQKPDPKFFRGCIVNEKIAPHEFLYIGDHLAKDIEGALAVGAKACFISQVEGVILSKEVQQFRTINNLYEWIKQR